MALTPSRKMVMLLQHLVEGQEQQNHLLKYIADTLAAERLQRTAALDAWKKANPLLSAACREASETWTKAQNAALTEFAEAVVNESEQLAESEFARREMTDRFGYPLQHLNALGTILQQLGSPIRQPAAARQNR